MTSREIQQRLASAVQSGNLYQASAELIEELEKSGPSLDAVTPILRFMEAHPDEDFGAPGPLVDFVETFYRRGYEEELLQSLRRKPTVHTLSMLNAVVNGTQDEGEIKRCIDVFREALAHPKTDKGEREAAAHYLKRAEDVIS